MTKNVSKRLHLTVISIVYADRTQEILALNPIELAGLKRSQKYRTAITVMKLQTIEFITNAKIYY